VKPQALHIAAVLADRPGEWVSALDFKRGRWGEHIDSVSQRVGELRRAGVPIESTGRGGIASYRFVQTAREEVRDDGLVQLCIV
jgi:hypothetical protein